MAIYTQKCEQKWLKINNSGDWNKDILGGKKIEKLTIGGRGGTIIRGSRVGPRGRMITELKSVAIAINIGNPSPELKGEWCLQKLAKRGDVR